MVQVERIPHKDSDVAVEVTLYWTVQFKMENISFNNHSAGCLGTFQLPQMALAYCGGFTHASKNTSGSRDHDRDDLKRLQAGGMYPVLVKAVALMLGTPDPWLAAGFA